MDGEYQIDIYYKTDMYVTVKDALLTALHGCDVDIKKTDIDDYHIVAYSNLSMEGAIFPVMRSLYQSGMISYFEWYEKYCTNTASDSNDYHAEEDLDVDTRFKWFVERYGYKELDVKYVQYTNDGDIVVMTHVKETPFESVHIGWSEADEDVWMIINDKDPAIGTTYAFAHIEDNPDCADLNEDTEAEY